MLVDTSVAVALLVEDHVAHEDVRVALRGHRLGLAGHAYFETYSVLTRLPGQARRDAADVALLLTRNFPETRHLDASATTELAERLPALGIAGGAVYDALVAAAAALHDCVLGTRDERALDTYRALNVDVRVISL